MSIAKHYGVDFFDVGPHPETGEMIVAYKCEDVVLGRVVLTGIALCSEAGKICRAQLELMALGLTGKPGATFDITRRGAPS